MDDHLLAMVLVLVLVPVRYGVNTTWYAVLSICLYFYLCLCLMPSMFLMSLMHECLFCLAICLSARYTKTETKKGDSGAADSPEKFPVYGIMISIHIYIRTHWLSIAYISPNRIASWHAMPCHILLNAVILCLVLSTFCTAACDLYYGNGSSVGEL